MDPIVLSALFSLVLSIGIFLLLAPVTFIIWRVPRFLGLAHFPFHTFDHVDTIFFCLSFVMCLICGGAVLKLV